MWALRVVTIIAFLLVVSFRENHGFRSMGMDDVLLLLFFIAVALKLEGVK
jgi:hypothetical protein